jgi:hypothetical protein
MRILFVMEKRVNAGSIQGAANYVRTADLLGHTIAVYGRPDSDFPALRFSSDVASFDYAVFIIESELGWLSGLRLSRLLTLLPRERRAVLDADGMYNRRIMIDGYDRNHGCDESCERWRTTLQLLAGKILQPTPSPLEPDVMPLLFYGYDPASEMKAAHSPAKRFDIAHVGHNWWRWRELDSKLLPGIERIRSSIGEICFRGLWWDGVPPWAASIGLETAFYADSERLRRLRIRVEPPVHYTEVVAAMSQARVNLMTQRPLFRHLGIITSKYFEVFCADTIPLVVLDPDQAEAVYGPAGRELALDGDAEEKLQHALSHPNRYRELVHEVRSHLTIHHCYEKRVQELVAALEAGAS